jgi:hypothetical protein
MKKLIYFTTLVVFTSCFKEDKRFDYSLFTEEKKECFRDYFRLPNAFIEENDTSHFYFKGRLVNPYMGIDENFSMIENSTDTLLKREGILFVTKDPNIQIGSLTNAVSTSTWFDLSNTPENYRLFGSLLLHIEFIPYEFINKNILMHKYFSRPYLKLTSTLYDTIYQSIDDRAGFEIGLLMGCTGTESTHIVIPQNVNDPQCCKILSYKRIDKGSYYTYKVKMSINAKFYFWGGPPSQEGYFAELKDGILHMKFDHKK